MPFVFPTFLRWWYDSGTLEVRMRYAHKIIELVCKRKCPLDLYFIEYVCIFNTSSTKPHRLLALNFSIQDSGHIFIRYHFDYAGNMASKLRKLFL